jgi:predicted DNA-binding protein YlxM (UPF0122 family)
MRDNSVKPEHTEVCLWLDFYGQLLTDRTREIMELYYQEDMSLSEIGELLGISRQGVHDKLRQGTSSLQDYEKKLKLAQRFLIQRDLARKALERVDNNDPIGARTYIEKLTDIL